MKTSVLPLNFFLLIIGLLLFNSSSAQKNFKGGIIITKEGQEPGLIDYRNWNINPNKVDFKKSEKEEVKSFSPLDINGFIANDEIYIGAIVDREVSEEKAEKMDFDPKLRIVKDTVFLLTLIEGEKGLYYLMDNRHKQHFYIKTENGYELLKYKKFLKDIPEKTIIVDYREYVSQLIGYLGDCSQITSLVNESKYSKKSLLFLFDYYYKCSKKDIEYKKKEDKTTFKFGAKLGGTISTLKFTGDGFSYLTGADATPSFLPSAGLFVEAVFPRNHKKWSFYNELFYTRLNVKLHDVDYESDINHTTSDSEIDFSYLKLNTLVKYKHPVGKLFLFGSAGFSNGFVLKQHSSVTKEIVFFSVPSTKEEVIFERYRSYERSFLGSVGVKRNKFSFEVRYEHGNGMSEYIVLRSTTKRWHLLFGYEF
ncbi:MAG: PorT family protein [Bacteroidetes bacterium]|nr:MAG: PorT family protein [Bacteroidota bacterium]